MRFVNVVTLLAAGLCVPIAAADDAVPPFRTPVQLKAGEAIMGAGILYPSPKLQDLDGDGVSEMLIGDLRGQLLFSKRQGSGDATQWTTLEPVQTADGKPIKFDNW